MSVYNKLSQLGITLPPVAVPAAAYVPFVRTGSYPARAENAVRPLVDGIPAFRRICEAIETARDRVWVTVTFMWPGFEMPDGRGSALDVLDRAAARAGVLGLARTLRWALVNSAEARARRRAEELARIARDRPSR